MPAAPRYVHALGWRILNQFYDPLLRLTMPERRFKADLIAASDLRPGHRMLDLGCGTGTLLMMVLAAVRGVRAAGIDGDEQILRIAQRKARHHPVPLVVARADALPCAPATFDRVLTTLVLHHLGREAKIAALAEAWRVLRPGGELHIADWGRPHTRLMQLASITVRGVDGRSTTVDNLEGRVPEFCASVGFQDVEETQRRTTLFGTLSFYRARKLAPVRTRNAP